MLSIAIVGAGNMGKVHSSSFLNVKGVKVAAICDIDKEKAAMIAPLHGASIYTDFDEMLRNEKIDVVDICLPTYFHKQFALKAIDSGKHVFCEKPIALNLKDAEEMASAANNKGVKLSVGHVVRYFPAYQNAVWQIEAGRIGTPKLIRTTMTSAHPSKGKNDWYSDYAMSGGVVMDLVIHDFDWIRHSFGEIERVYAKSLAAKDKKLVKQDHCLVVLRLKNGAIAHVEGSWAYPPGTPFKTTFEIIGTKGQIEYDSSKSIPVKKHILTGNTAILSTESPLFADEEPYTRQLQAFIDSIYENKEPDISARDAIKALEISLAAIKSAETGETIFLGDENQ